MVKEMRKLSVKAIILIVLMSWAIAEGASAQGEKTPRKRNFPPVILKTNLLYDMLAAPAIGVECSPATKWSVALNGAYGWTDGGPFGDRVRVVTGDAELRYWLGSRSVILHRGLHLGVYGAYYRYDFLFNGDGQQAKFNWGAGLNCGYAVPLSRYFSLDFNIGVGYVAGDYKTYEVSNDDYHHNVWTANKVRHFFGPTKAGITLVWHLGRSSAQKSPKSSKGGGR
jgi:hypothetical protein